VLAGDTTTVVNINALANDQEAEIPLRYLLLILRVLLVVLRLVLVLDRSPTRPTPPVPTSRSAPGVQSSIASRTLAIVMLSSLLSRSYSVLWRRRRGLMFIFLLRTRCRCRWLMLMLLQTKAPGVNVYISSAYAVPVPVPVVNANVATNEEKRQQSVLRQSWQ
jgi:hypothetical protein